MWCGEYNFSRIWKIIIMELLFTRCMSSSDTLNGKDLRSCSKFDSGHRPATESFGSVHGFYVKITNFRWLKQQNILVKPVCQRFVRTREIPNPYCMWLSIYVSWYRQKCTDAASTYSLKIRGELMKRGEQS